MCIEAYAAGLLDGEGCISVYGRGQLQVRIKVGDLESLDLLASKFGGGLYEAPAPSGRPMWTWNLSGVESQDFLRCVLPYLIVKRSQARLALDYPVMALGQRLERHHRDKRNRIRDALKDAKGHFHTAPLYVLKGISIVG